MRSATYGEGLNAEALNELLLTNIEISEADVNNILRLNEGLTTVKGSRRLEPLKTWKRRRVLDKTEKESKRHTMHVTGTTGLWSVDISMSVNLRGKIEMRRREA